MNDSLALMHLMSAKLCHDLSAPASAVLMGLEMLSNTPSDAPTLELVTNSAQSTIAKLEVFRCVTGFAGNSEKPTGEDVLNGLKKLWSDGKILLDWHITTPHDIKGTPARLLISMLLCAGESLIRGGTVRVMPNFTIIATGESARMMEDVQHALTRPLETGEVTVKTILPHFAFLLSKELGARIEFTQHTGSVELSLVQVVTQQPSSQSETVLRA